MKNYNDYLENIGISNDSLKNKISEIISYFNKFYSNEDLRDIFVSDYIDQDGNRNYTSLWLIYEDRICEAKNFINEVDIDSTYYTKNQVVYWNLKSKLGIKDDFNDSDRLSLNVTFNKEALRGEFKAAKNNCTYLMYILKEYFVTRN